MKPATLALCLIGLAPAWGQRGPPAYEVEPGRNTQAAAVAYGFCYSQQRMLDRVAELYPDLMPRARLVAVRFRDRTGHGCEAIVDAFRRMVSTRVAAGDRSASWPEFDVQLTRPLEDALKHQSAALTDRSVANRFMDEIEERTAGHLDKEVLATLLAASPTYRAVPARLILDGHTQFFRTSGHTKSPGVDVQIKVPLSWESSEANGPHIVQKWTSHTGHRSGTAMLMVSVFPLNAAATADVERELAQIDPVTLATTSAPNGGTLLEAHRITLLQRPAVVTTWSIRSRQMDKAFEGVLVQYQAIARGGIVQVQGSVMAEAGDFHAEEVYERYSPLFRLVANSLTDMRSQP
jgi:hypothetical protein